MFTFLFANTAIASFCQSQIDVDPRGLVCFGGGGGCCFLGGGGKAWGNFKKAFTTKIQHDGRKGNLS